jgi:hypothetical protein
MNSKLLAALDELQKNSGVGKRGGAVTNEGATPHEKATTTLKRHFSEFIGEVSNWQFFAVRRLAGKEGSGF